VAVTALLRHLSPFWTAWSGSRRWRNCPPSATRPTSAFRAAPEGTSGV